MKSRFIFFTLFLSLCVVQVNAQYSGLWKKYRYELQGGTGTTNFMGDLGGGNKEPAHFMGVRDLDFVATRPLINGALRYKLYEILALKLSLSYGLLSGNDALTKDPGRQDRNLHFRTYVFEPSLQLEFYILKDRGKKYLSVESKLINNLSIYLFAGAGAVFFNPKASYFGKWIELQPLGTEGQGLPKYPSSALMEFNPKTFPDTVTLMPPLYKKVAISVPMGIGFKYNFSRRQAISIEIGNHYTSTDYLDDVSGGYYHYNWIEHYRGLTAAQMADRHLHLDPVGDQMQWIPFPVPADYRGDDDYNDAFIFININFIYKLKTTGKGLPKF